MRGDDLSRFESRLTGDEGSVARDEQKLQRDEVKLTQDDEFARRLGQQASDMRAGMDAQFASPPATQQASASDAYGQQLGQQASDMRAQQDAQFGSPPATKQAMDAPQFSQQQQRGPMLNFSMADDINGGAPVQSGGPTGADMMRNAGIPVRDMSDAGGMFSPAVQQNAADTGYQSPAPGEAPSRFLGARDAGGPMDPSRMPPAEAPQAGATSLMQAPQPQSMQLSMPQSRFIAAHHDASMIPDTKGTIGQRFRNEADMGAGIQHEMTAQQRQNKIVGLTLQNQEYEQADELAKNKAEEDQRQARVAIRAAKRDKAIDDAANGKEDPNRIFNNADTGTKIALGIGAFFGGLIPGVRPLMDMLGGNIQRDIEAQRQDKHNKQWGVEQKRLAMGQDREDDQDHRSFELQNQAQKWALAEKQIKSLMLRTDDPILKARGEQALAATGARITGLKQEYDRLSYVRPQVVGGGSSTGKGFVVKLPDGRQVLAPNEKKFDELTTKSAQVTNIQSNISRALSLRKNANALELANPLSATHRQLAALQAETAQLVTVARGQGAMSKGDQAVADEAIGSMTGIMDNNNEVLRSTGARFGEQLSREADALGAEHVQTGYQVDANGRIQRDVALTGEADKPRPNMPKGKPVR